MARLYINKLKCIQSVNQDGDQVTLEESNPPIPWSSETPISNNQERFIGEEIEIGSEAQIKLLVNEDDLVGNICLVGANRFLNSGTLEEQCEFPLGSPNYILYYVEKDVPILTRLIALVIFTLQLVRQFVLQVINLLKHIGWSNTLRYQQQLRNQQQRGDSTNIDEASAILPSVDRTNSP